MPMNNLKTLLITTTLFFSSCVPIKKMVYLQNEDNPIDKVFEYERVDYLFNILFITARVDAKQLRKGLRKSCVELRKSCVELRTATLW